MDEKITEKEIKILKHTLGWPKMYRNYFCTDPRTADHSICEALVRKGLMRKSPYPLDEIGQSWVYTVTDKGLAVVKEEDKNE